MVNFDESQCCCVEKTDPFTRKGFRACNCTQPAVQQIQNCACKAVANAKNATHITCACSDCNNQVATGLAIPAGQCRCPASFYNYSASLMNGNQGKNENTTANSTKTNGTNSTTGSNTTNTNTTKVNTTTNGTSVTTNGTNTTGNGTKSNTTSNGTSVATNGTNATTNGTKTNGTNGTTNASTNGNTTTNTTKTNTTTGSNNTSNTTTGSNQTTGANSTNTTKPNSTTGGNSTSNQNSTNQTTTPVVTPPPADIFSCSCEVPFQGLCPALNPTAPITEGTCDASNLPKQLRANGNNPVSTAVNAGCKYQYEYLVAVIATNKDSSVLMQLQSYQTSAMQAASYLSSFASLFVLVASVFLFY